MEGGGVMARTIKSMNDSDLLSEYRVLSSWSGDDFCLSPMGDAEYRRLDRLEQEILRRMGKWREAA
jgi:hypothetical protein